MSSHKTERAWAAAIRRSVMRQVSRDDKRTRLEAIADKVTAMAVEGDMAAVAEVGNRLDGKAKQQLEIEVNQRMTIVIGAGMDAARLDAIDVEDASRGIDTETAVPLPAPDVYEHDTSIALLSPTATLPAEKRQSIQRSSTDDEHVGSDHMGGEHGEEGRETAVQRLRGIRARIGLHNAPIVPVDGVIGDAEHAEHVPASPYACVYAATGQQAAPCAVCQRMPACPRRVGDAVAP